MEPAAVHSESDSRREGASQRRAGELGCAQRVDRKLPAGEQGASSQRVSRCCGVVMLHKRRRRVAAHAGCRRTAERYYQVLLLLLCLTTSSITAIAVSSSGEQKQHLRRSPAATGAGGSGVVVGAAAQRIIGRNVWTAGKKVETLGRSHNSCSGGVATAAAGAAAGPTDGVLRERIRRSLLEVRGGSEGLKSEKWSREKAEAGAAARAGAGGHPGLQKVSTQGEDYFQSSSREGVAAAAPASLPRVIVRDELDVVTCDQATPVAGDAGIGVGLREGAAAAAPGAAGIRVGGGEPQSTPVDENANRNGKEQNSTARGVGLASHDDAGMVLGVEEDRRSFETAPVVGGGGSAAAAAASRGAGLVRDSAQKEAAAVGAAAAAAPEGATARDQPSPAVGAFAAGSTRGAIGLADSGVGGESGGVDSSEVSSGERGFGDEEDALDLFSEQNLKGATAVRKRRRTATTKVASGGWTKKPVPPEEPGATGNRAVTGSRPNNLPRAGAPRPPRGEVRVWRPWGRHGAAAPSGAGVSDNGVVVEGTAAPGGGVAAGATAAAGSEVVAVVGQEAGADEVVGKAKAKRMRWEPKYLTVKAVFFLFYSSLGAIMPYLPVYYHSLGIPDRRIGHLGAITPAMTFLFTPLWGALTDKSGMLKQILVLTFAASTLLRVSLSARTSFFWIVSVITLTAIINAPVRPLLDSSALQSLDDRAEYGKQRLWGQWGFGIGSFLTGKLLSRFGFKAAFYMHAAFSLPTLLILMRFSPKKEDRGKEPPKFGELYQLVVHDPDVLVFFSMVFAIGLSSGVIENFAYKRLRELGGTGSVLGVSRLVSSLSGIPMFFFSGAIVKHFSIVGILTASMMSFIARFVIYASIKNPWAGLPAEALRGVTFAGFWAASTCHVGAIAPPGLSTTMLGLLNATYGGIGQSLGSLIGGSLSMSFGTARAFLVYASVDACLLLAFFLFWGLHPNGQQKDRRAGGGIGASSEKDMGKASPHADPLTAAAAATATTPTPQQPPEGLQDQTFTPPPAVGQR